MTPVEIHNLKVALDRALHARNEMIELLGEIFERFGRDMTRGSSTAEQQATLRWLKAVLVAYHRIEG